MRCILPLLLAPFLLALPGLAGAVELKLPIDCALGQSCWVQQMPDMAAGPDAQDPFCGTATYDGHDGTDIRVRSMADVTAGVPVLAAADGTVKGMRDGVADKVVETDADRAAVKDIECGNGVLLDNGEGLETQYCHMREGSVAVKEGQTVKAGDVLGMVGASGMAQFPHVHLSVRQDGQTLDPSTGRKLDQGCATDPASVTPLWETSVPRDMPGETGALLDLGFAGAPVEHEALSQAPPAPPDASSQAFVGWAWFINLEAGDVIHLALTDAQGNVIADNTLPALDRSKADYSAFVGKRGAPPPGSYTMTAWIVRGGEELFRGEKTLTVQ